MHKVLFYRDKKGGSPVLDYLHKLAASKSKDSRIKLTKIGDYLQMLKEHGTQAGEPYVKHLDGAIWELRPIRDGILFVAYTGDSYVLLHHFMKKTQKTPAKEIAKAKLEYEDLLARGSVYGKD